MAKQKISTQKKQPTPEQKKKRLEKQFTDFTGNEITVEHAYLMFKIAQQEKGNTKPTLDFYDRMYKKLIAHLDTISKGDGKNMPIDWLVQDGAQLWFTLSLGNVSQQTINAYLRGYRAFGNYCEEKGLIDGFKCPIKEVEPPIKNVYTDKELQLLTVKPKIEKFTEYRNYTIIILILATGARINTLINLKIKDVDIENGYIHFNTTKAHKTVILGLEPKARKELAEYIAYWRTQDTKPTDYLFCNEYGEQLTRNGLYNAIADYNKRRGVEKTSVHLLRHTFAKNWITSGGDLITLSKVLTHSDLEMAKRYSNLYGEDVKAELEEHSTLSQLRTKSGKTLRGKK